MLCVTDFSVFVNVYFYKCCNYSQSATHLSYEDTLTFVKLETEKVLLSISDMLFAISYIFKQTSGMTIMAFLVQLL